MSSQSFGQSRPAKRQVSIVVVSGLGGPRRLWRLTPGDPVTANCGSIISAPTLADTVNDERVRFRATCSAQSFLFEIRKVDSFLTRFRKLSAKSPNQDLLVEDRLQEARPNSLLDPIRLRRI